MRVTLKNFFDWKRLTSGSRGLPLLFAFIVGAAGFTVFACDDTGPTPIGDHPEPDAEAPEEEPEADAATEAGEDDAGDAGDASDAGDAKADG